MVSVIMPAYNAEKTIKEAVSSVISQTEKDWELIVVDDGSIDNTAEILTKLSLEDKRIRFLKNDKNRGVCYTRNKAISLAEGEWIAFLDSDDIWFPKKLQKQLELAKKYPDMAICYTASDFMNEKGEKFDYILEAVEMTDYNLLLKRNLLSCSSVMLRSSIMKNIKMPDDRLNEDYYTWLKVLGSGEIAYGINEPLITYRLSSNSRSSNRIKSAKMLFNTYRAVNFSTLIALFLVFRYTFYSISKRHNIYKSTK